MDYSIYLELCEEIGKKFSKCLSRKVGALLLTEDLSIVSSGYNGPARKVPHCDSSERLEWLVENVKKNKIGSIREFFLENGYGKRCPRQIMKFPSGHGLEYCTAGHGERNCLINAGRNRVKTVGTTLVVNTGIPCSPCSIEIVNAGVVRVVCYKWDKDYDIGARWILQKGGVEIIEI